MTYEQWYSDNEMSGWTDADYMIGFKAWNAGFEEAKRLTFQKFPKLTSLSQPEGSEG